MTFAAGNDLSAAELNTVALYGSVIARGQRTTNSTAASAQQGVLRIDDVALVSGNVYWIGTGPLAVDTTVANDVGRLTIRVSSSGVATTASTTIQIAQVRLADAAQQETISVGALYAPATDETLSVILTTTRQSGTGNISLTATSSTPIELFVIDCGVDPGDTGVDL